MEAGGGWSDQEAELQELREAIFPRQAQFPFGEQAPGGATWPDAGGPDAAFVRTPRLHNRDAELVKRVLRGRPQSLDDVAARKSVVRFFVSSTFTDTKSERDAFFAFCVPYLRQRSRLKGLEFQVSEMRWGINDGLSQSHQTAAVCMAELKRCVDESASLQFVGILGNKYGYRPFPAEIEAGLFARLVAAAGEGKALFEKWWCLDENQQPPMQVLRPVKEVIPAYNPNVYNKYAKTWWSECFEPMQAMLRRGAIKLAKEDPKMKRHVATFVQSVTEDEMRRGFNGTNETLLIMRELGPAGKENGEADGTVDDRRYIDLGDADAAKRLKALKKDIAAKAEATGPILRYRVPWKPGGIDPCAHAEHADYLRGVLTDWTRVVERSIDEIKSFNPDPVFEEAQAHLRFALAKVRDFIGREQLVEQVRNGLAAHSAVVVHGCSGSGKTSLLSKVALSVADKNANVCVRFLGTTLASKSATALLRSLCEQIARTYTGIPPEELPDDFHKLVALFHNEYLPMATAAAPLYLFVDSLDQLADTDNLSWLPHAENIPPHVKIVVSALPDLVERRVADKHYPVEVGVEPIKAQHVKSVLDRWLKARKRALSVEQRQALMDVIARAESPPYLLLRILFNEALLWRSSTPVPKAWATITDVPSAIGALFDRIEAEHGKTFVGAALALLTASRDGLTANELEDLLSCNDMVLKECFQWWVPVVPRVPPLLVTRLLGSLQDYIVTQKNTWFHSQLREAVACRYESTDAVRSIADYFGETMHVDPYMLHEEGRHNVRLSSDRRIQPQPTVLENGTYNERKLRELPAALMTTGRYADALVLAKDADFCRGMFACGLANELLDLLRDVRLPEPSFRKFYHRALMQCRNDVSHDLSFLEEHLWARLEPVLGKQHDFIRCLDAGRRATSGLHARFSNIMNAANSPLLTTIRGHTGVVEAICELAVSANERFMVSAAADQFIKIWNVSTTSLEKTLRMPCAVTSLCAFESMLAVGLADASVCFFDARKWQRVGELPAAVNTASGDQGGHTASVNDVCVVQTKSGLVLLTASSDSTCKVWDAHSFKLLNTLNAHFEPANAVCAVRVKGAKGEWAASASDDRSLTLYNSDDGWQVAHKLAGAHEGAVYAIASAVLDGGATILVSGSFDKTAKLWDPSNEMAPLAVIQHQGSVSSLCSVRLIDGRILICMGSADNTITVYDPQTLRELVTLSGHSNSVHALCGMLTNDGRHLLASGSCDHDIKLWEVGADDAPLASSQAKAHARAVTSVCGITTKAGDQLIASGSEDTTLKVWSARNGAPYCTIDFHSLGINSVQGIIMRPSGQALIVTGGRDEKIGAFDMETCSLAFSLPAFSGHVSGIRCVESHGLLLYSDEESVHVYDVVKRREVAALKGHGDEIQEIIAADVAGLGLVIATGVGRQSRPKDCSVRLFSADKGGKMLRQFSGHTARVNAICVVATPPLPPLKGPPKPVLASGSDDRSIILWDLTSGDKRGVLQGHTNCVEALQVVPSTTCPLLVSAARSDALRVWSVQTGDLVATLEAIPAQDPRSSFRVVSTATGGGSRVVCACTDKSVHVFDAHAGRRISSTVFPGTAPTTVAELGPGALCVGCSNGRVTAFDLTV